MNYPKIFEFCAFHKLLNDHLLSNNPNGVSAEFLSSKIIDYCYRIYGQSVNASDDMDKVSKLLVLCKLPYTLALSRDKSHWGLEIDTRYADTAWHINKLMSIFADREMKLDMSEDMTFDVGVAEKLRETFTNLYNIAYDPFFVAFTDKVYHVDEVNMLMQMRHIPFYIRTFVAPMYVCRYQVVDVNWGNY